jgi:hypothetical protein
VAYDEDEEAEDTKVPDDEGHHVDDDGDDD